MAPLPRASSASSAGHVFQITWRYQFPRVRRGRYSNACV